MKCPKCDFENREGAKFCNECGHKFELTCPECGTTIRPRSKFCDECGHDLRESKEAPAVDYNKPQSYTPKFMADKILTTRSSLEGERKRVTVFFSDVAGFTTLSEKSDPEAVHQIMDGCFKILMEQIHKYEGTINQFTGDGVMALFGAPLAHEDHAQRACYAALAIQKSLVEYGQKIEREFGLDFKMRIGLNSGPVVVGAIGDDLRMDYTAVGDTTNLAARMEGMAEPGGILISDNTYRLVKIYFRFKSLGKVPIKGKKELQEVYELIEMSDVRSRLDASEARGLTTYIGRDEEMNNLLHLYEKIQDGRGQVVGIVGEAGVGKSRFVFEARKRIDGPYKMIESRCLQYGSNIPFLPILEIFRFYFDIQDGDPEEEITKKLESMLEDLDENLVPFIPAFRDFLSLPVKDDQWANLDPEEKRIKTFEAIRNLLIRLGQESPLILVVDDLQWIDKTSEEFISYFIEWMANTRIFLLLLYRHEYNHLWGSKSFYNQIGIYQLSEEESRQLVRLIFTDGEITPDLEELIIGRTSGNPFFMEELTFTLIENGTIEKMSGRYQLSQTISEVQVPDTVQGIIAGRMDRLEDNIKRTMQVASVIGRNFAFKILQMITGLSDELKSYLLRLQSLEFVYEKRLFPELEYIFKNAVTQEVAYNSLLLNRRREIHANIGVAIENMYATQLEEFFEVLAYHFSRSDKNENALRYLKLSGDKAMRNNSSWEAFEFYKAAMDIQKRFLQSFEQKQELLEIIHSMMSPIILLGFPEESMKILEEGAELSKELNDQKSLIRFYSNMGFYHSLRGKHQEGIHFSGKAFEEASSIGDITSMAQTAPDLCIANLSAGRYAAVIDLSSRMIHAIKKAGRERDNFGGPAVVYASFFALSGYSEAHLGKFDKGMTKCRKGIEEAAKSDSAFTKSLCSFNTGMSLLLRGSWKEAKDYFLSGLEYLERAKFVQIEGMAKAGLGVAETYLGDPKLGKKLIEEGLTMHQNAGIEWQVSEFKGYMGMCCYESGDLDDALRFSNEAFEVAVKNDQISLKGRALIWVGRIAGKLSDETANEAESKINEGLDLLNTLNLKPDISIGQLFLGELYAERNQQDQARLHLKEAKRLFKEMGMDYWSEETERTIDRSDLEDMLP